ncbi:Putative ribonuclease H protein At1g65750 [Linum perenne]
MIPVGPPDTKDKWVWHFDPNGRFSVKSCYRLLKQGRHDAESEAGGWLQGVWKWIWRMNIPPKLKFFSWKVCAELLPTKANLFKRRCSPTPICQCCNEFDETSFHLLFGCAKTKELWSDINPPWNLPSSQQTMESWFSMLAGSGHVGACETAALGMWDLENQK